jgi:hypothetical protein
MDFEDYERLIAVQSRKKNTFMIKLFGVVIFGNMLLLLIVFILMLFFT